TVFLFLFIDSKYSNFLDQSNLSLPLQLTNKRKKKERKKKRTLTDLPFSNFSAESHSIRSLERITIFSVVVEHYCLD
ncbi:hypothetical protein QQP08_019418, partial [Theobroma cacao]